jgi:hypothetical protein
MLIEGIGKDQVLKGVPLDWLSSSLPNIDVFHQMIHAGKAFTLVSYDTDVDIAAPKLYRLTAPASPKQVHLTWEFKSLAAGTVYVYENPTLTAQGSTLTPINMNRNSAAAAVMTIGEDATQSSLGTQIWVGDLTTAGAFFTTLGGNDGNRHEFVLKYEEEYLIRFVTTADNNTLRTSLFWYEV